MKTVLPILTLYFKAGFSVSAIPIGVCVGVCLFLSPTAAFFFYPSTSLIFFFMLTAMAFKLHSVDTLLFTSGISPAKRLVYMFAGRALHLLLVAACIAILYTFSPPNAKPHVSLIGHLYVYLKLIFLLSATTLLWVDLQARRFAGMRPWDSVIIFIVGQLCISYSIGWLGYLVPLASQTQSIPSSLFLTVSTAPAFMLTVFMLSRILSAHSLLKESEIA
jgi:hypothetical protein